MTLHRLIRFIIVTLLAGIPALFAMQATAQSLPIGALAQDGPPTPEQIALVVPVTGSLPTTATAAVRYRAAGAATWVTGHALYRVRPSFSNTPAVGSVTDVFAWPILDLVPGTTYNVEVTVSNGGTSQVLTGNFATRALPAAAGPATKTIAAGSSSATIQSVLDSLVPGDVLVIQPGTYNVSGLNINRSGTAGNPIYVRGASRTQTILSDPSGRIIELRGISDVVIENMTVRGSLLDSGTNASSEAVRGGDPYTDPVRVTVRNLTVLGVDKGVTVYGEASQMLVYDNTIAGNNIWITAFLTDNRTWNDDGINLPGFGNAAFNNTISGFGDTFSYAQHGGDDTLTEARSVHYYRNDIRNSLDDAVEVDHGHRNLTFYDNRIVNASTCSSLDPLYGGPLVYARNVCVNPARVNIHKWNDTNSGQFIYNSTFISTSSAVGGDPDVSGWYQPNNGSQRAYGYRNNIHVYRGNGNMLWLESPGHEPIDWTHNSWFPARPLQWGGNYSTLAAAQSGLANTTPIFSGTSRRMENDNITTSNPWTTTITLGLNSLIEVLTTVTPVLASGTSPKNSGVVIPNITDSFSGAAPDRGAVISGRAVQNWGDRSAGAQVSPPNPPTAVTVQ